MAFIKLINLRVEGNKWLGSILRITAIFNTGPDTANITVEDPNGTDRADQVAMSVEANSSNRVWTYIYTSDEDHDAGQYQVIIRATKGSDTLLESQNFYLEDASDD